MDHRRILVIAGSDSSGGAGLEADQKVIAAHGCYAMTATTALTAQNTTGVKGIHQTPPAFVRQQIDAVVEDVGVDVVKTGMLASAETVSVVADAIKHYSVSKVVIDPVMVSTSGSQLLPESAIHNVLTLLLPLTTILTPNIPEARLLLKHAGVAFKEPETLDDVFALARSLKGLGPKYVLLKGGHLPLTSNGREIAKSEADRAKVVDVLDDGKDRVVIESDYLRAKNTHGTGCSLASAIASNLALGLPVVNAVRRACEYVEVGIKTACSLGHGSGPINHFHSSYRLPFSRGYFVSYVLSHPLIAEKWHQFTHHPFTNQLAADTLPLNSFTHYLTQDYLFLSTYARVHALAASKYHDVAAISTAASLVAKVKMETKLHLEYCASFGLAEADLEAMARRGEACMALATKLYTQFLLVTAYEKDVLHVRMAMLPCLLGYNVIAERIHADPCSVHGQYWRWVENYVADHYVTAVREGVAEVEDTVAAGTFGVEGIESLVVSFLGGLEREIAFWEMALHPPEGWNGKKN